MRYIIFFAFLRKIAHLQIPIADGSRVTLHLVSLLQQFFILYLERNAITRLISERASERAKERYSLLEVFYIHQARKLKRYAKHGKCIFSDTWQECFVNIVEYYRVP